MPNEGVERAMANARSQLATLVTLQLDAVLEVARLDAMTALGPALHRHAALFGAGLQHDRPQARIHVRITAAGFGRERDIAGKAAENFTALGIVGALGALDRRPFTVS